MTELASAGEAGGERAGAARPETERCRNCDAPLSGPYCSRCGQHARGSARSMRTLLVEARDALVHLDGRLWRTLGALLLRPGFLTLEYFRERRASYVPPFRLYLAASLAFFSLAFVAGPKRGPLVLDDDQRAEARREMEEAAAELRSTPGVPPAAVRALEEAARQPLAPARAGTSPGGAPGEAARSGPAPADPGAEGAGGRSARVCEGIQVPGSPALERALTEACRRTAGDQGRGLTRNMAANIPRMMFVFLPLMALVMKGLYWRPRRYYLEHLVFFLQTHAAVFLLFTAALALDALGRRAPGMLGATGRLAGGLLWFYAAWYVWRSLRVYYGQGRVLTLAKFAALAVAYLAFLSVTLVGTAVITALES